MGIRLEDPFKAKTSSLKSLCIDAIVTTIRKPPLITRSKLEHELFPIRRKHMMDRLASVAIPSNLVEILLEEFSKNNCLNGDVLSLFTLHANYDNINVLKLLKFSTDVLDDDLSRYNSFRLKKLHLSPTQLNNWNVGKLITSFQGSRESLTSLKLEFNPGNITVESGNIFEFITQFPNLTSLHYDSPTKDSHTIFTNENWDKLVSSCPKLHTICVHLNVKTVDKYEFDSSIFRELTNLQRLCLRNIFKSSTTLKNSNCLSHFTMMDSLRHLDISIDSSPNDLNQPFNTENGEDIYMRTHSGVLAGYVGCFLKMALGKLPSLEYLDLSGIILLGQKDIENFIIDHPNLNFLGLCMVRAELCTDDYTARNFSNLRITGCVLEEQIITSLLAYPDRVKYMREVLKGLFQISSSWKSRKPLIVKIVLDIMDRFKEYEDIQWVATACIYQLCRDDENITDEFDSSIVNEISKAITLTTIQHIGNLHIVKNCLLILSSEAILYNANHNREFTAWICLGCMATYPESVDRYVTQMAVTIIAVLAVEMSPKDRANMLQERDMLLFLSIIQERLDAKTIDATLRWLLEVVWSFTDNSPHLIALFTKLGGLQKYLDMLDVFAEDLYIQTDVLGLLFNIAEMLQLDKDLIMRIKGMTSSSHIPASYFACGVLANFSLRWDNVENDLTVAEKQECLADIQTAIDRFGVREEKIVNYKTFKPIYNLLGSHQKAEIQHWAVWTIHHLCTVDTNNYRKLMNKTCYDLLQDIRCRNSSAIVRGQINGIYEALEIEHEKKEL